MLLPALAAVAVAGCDPEPEPAASSAPPAAASPSPPVVRLTPPPEVAGELSRVVLSREDGHPSNNAVIHRSARAGQDYWVHAACTSTTPGKTLSLEVRSGEPGAPDEAMATAEIPCDGNVTVNGLGRLPAETIVVYLRGDQSDLPSAYALIAPTPSLQAR